MGRKTVTISQETFDKLDEQRDGRVWDAFLEQLLDDTTTEPSRDVVEARITGTQYTELYGMLSGLDGKHSGTEHSSELAYDDVVTACRTALREELPDQVLQG